MTPPAMAEDPNVPMSQRSDSANRHGFMGSELSALTFALIVALTTTVFLFWRGPLWTAKPGESHLDRIAISYLLAIPLVAAALWKRRTFSVGRLLGGVGIVWSAKLVITASLYAYVAPGAGNVYAPARSWEDKPSAAPATTSPVAVTASTEVGAIAGAVLERGGGPARAVVFVEGTRGAAAAGSSEARLVIQGSAYSAALLMARVDDSIAIESRDPMLHTLRLAQDGRALWNAPVPAEATIRQALPSEPGTYELSCENHPSERATLVVVDTGLAAMTDDQGRFELRGVPAGSRAVVVVASGAPPLRQVLEVPSGGRIDVRLEIGSSAR